MNFSCCPTHPDSLPCSPFCCSLHTPSTPISPSHDSGETTVDFSCDGSSSSAPPSTSPPSSPAPPSTSPPSTSPPSSSSCTTSTLAGYTYSAPLESSLKLHWSTVSATQVNLALEVAAGSTAAAGWFALAWSADGRMAPADAVIGNLPGGAVAAYYMSGYGLGDVQPTSGFGIGSGAALSTSASGSKVMKFSRTASDGSIPVNVNGSNMLIWAYSQGGSQTLGFHGENDGEITLDFSCTTSSTGGGSGGGIGGGDNNGGGIGEGHHEHGHGHGHGDGDGDGGHGGPGGRGGPGGPEGHGHGGGNGVVGGGRPYALQHEMVLPPEHSFLATLYQTPDLLWWAIMSPHAHRCRTSVARLLLSHIAPPRPTLPPSAYLAPSAQLAPAPPDSRQPLHTLIPHRSAPDSAALNSACTPLVPTSYWLRDSATSAIADGLSDSRVLLLYVCPAEPVFPALIAPSAQSILPLVESAARRYSSSALKSPANAEGSSREVEGLPGSVGNEDLEKVLGAEQMGGFGTSEKSGGRGGGEEEQACGSGGELLRGMEGEEKAVGRGGGGEQRIVVYRGRWMQGLRLMDQGGSDGGGGVACCLVARPILRDRPSPSLPSPPAAAVCCLHAARCRLNLAQMVGVAWLASLPLGTSVAVAAVVGGAAAASACLWFYSSRYVGELALIGPAPEAAAAGDGDGDGDGQQWRVCISTLDFWGNRENLILPLSALVPPLKGLSQQHLKAIAHHSFVPLD
ncbi:unnamed protein product, partial [Closterium sp. NIES-53]